MSKKVLCVCLGNSDRSPVMAGVLGLMLRSTSPDVACESAGTAESARTGTAAKFGLAAAKKLGLDLSGHKRRHVDTLNLKSYDLIVCASDEIAGAIIQAGAEMGKVYNAQIPNPWPVQFQEDFDAQTMPLILAGMYRVITRYFA